MRRPWTGLWAVVREVHRRFVADDGLPLAGSIAYHAILSVFPFLIIVTALAGFVGDADLARRAVSFLMDVAPHQVVEPFVPEIESLLSEPRRDFLSLGIVLTLWAASGGVDAVRIGLNRAYGLAERRRWHVLYAQNIAFIAASALMLMALAVLIVFGPLLVGSLDYWLPAFAHLTAYFDMLRYPLALLILVVGVTAAHKFLPTRAHPWHELWPGIAFTVAVWLAVAAGYSLYLARFSYFASTYAGLGGVIAGLIFLYLTAAVLLLGGEVNRAIALVRRGAEAPRTPAASEPEITGAAPGNPSPEG